MDEDRTEPRTESQQDALREQVKELVYLFSHDMRNPLVNLKALIGELNELLAEALGGNPDVLATDMPDVVSMMDISVGRLNDLIAGANELYHCMFDEIECEKVDLQELVGRIVTRYRGRPGLSFEFDTLPVIHADPLFMRRMIELMIENAMREPGEKGVVISLSADIRDRQCDLYVRRCGSGLSADGGEAAHIRPEGAQDSAAAGMELAIVRAIAAAHGGTMQRESVSDGGYRFHVCLPQAAE